MKWLAAVLAFFPAVAFAALSGVDDVEPNIPTATQEKLDSAVMNYYRKPSVATVNTVLDIMNDSDVLRKKTAWPTFVGFLSIVFAENKNHVMAWMSRNDYNTYAEDVFINALLNAGLTESASVFAQAHQWKKADLDRLHNYKSAIDLKKLPIVLPGHIDTLWGAFFASGDPVYVNEIIEVLFMTELPTSSSVTPPAGYDVLGENKKLAQTSLKAYALEHKTVREALKKRLGSEKDKAKQKILEDILPKISFPEK